MVLSPLRGALRFLTRLPVGGDAADWRAFTDAPWTFPVVAAPVGLALSVPLLLTDWLEISAVAGVAFLGVLVLLVGTRPFDGVAGLADAAAGDGDSDQRVARLEDAEVGVSGLVAVVVVLLATASSATVANTLAPAGAVAAVVGAELAAKTAMAGLACLGNAAHEGVGSQLTDWNRARELGPVALAVAVVLLLVVAVAPAAFPATLGALVGGLLAGWLVARRANNLLGGVNGEVFGAVDVAARLVGLSAGVVGVRWADALLAVVA